MRASISNCRQPDRVLDLAAPSSEAWGGLLSEKSVFEHPKLAAMQLRLRVAQAEELFF
ncbi:MAG: hypothetical protein HZA50_09750 [Planctomycetes bacterium]|nr:hypothetical protein [Planctomycetota bacterium]